MMKSIRILTLACAITAFMTAYAQTDSTEIERQITVEREYQPVIQSAGKLNYQLNAIEKSVTPTQIVYSETPTRQPASAVTHHVQPLAASNISFTKPQPAKGYLEGAVGHPLTRFNFQYAIQEKKGMRLNLYANHNAIWWPQIWEQTRLGMDFSKRYSESELYFSIAGSNQYYTYYINNTFWKANAKIGYRSNKREGFIYRVETGYQAFILPSAVTDHQIQTHLDLGYLSDTHGAGMNVYVQNDFMTLDTLKHSLPDSVYRDLHSLRINPYYTFRSNAVRLRVGINIDVNIGGGQMLSGSNVIAFAPSPDIHFEYRIIPSWLLLYADAKGSFGHGTLSDFFSCPYRAAPDGIYNIAYRSAAANGFVQKRPVSEYTPIDAAIGFRFKPLATFLIDIYAQYAYLKNQVNNITDFNHSYGGLSFEYADYQRWTVGTQMSYRYQDIIAIHLGANYYKWISETGVYDRPSWDLHLRVDGRIDSKWSLYTDNYFAGSRTARQQTASNTFVNRPLKAWIDLKLGAQYEINRSLSVYAEINNLLHRSNDLYYGYQAPGISAFIGAKWQF